MSSRSKFRHLFTRDRNASQPRPDSSSRSSSLNPTTSKGTPSPTQPDPATLSNASGVRGGLQPSSSAGPPPAASSALISSSSPAAAISTPNPSAQHGGSTFTVPVGTQKDFWDLAVQALRRDDPSAAEKLTSVLSSQTSQANADSFTQLRQMADQKRQEIERNRSKMAIGSRVIVLHDCLDKIVKTLTPLKEMATAAASIDPVHAGLPVAAFCFLMQIVSSNNDQFAAMVAGMADIVPIIARWRSVESLYRLRQGTALNQHFEDRLIRLYTNTIRYQLAAVVYFERGSASRIFRSIPKFDDVSEVLKAIQNDDTACERLYQTFSWHDTQNILTGNQDILAEIQKMQAIINLILNAGKRPMNSTVTSTNRNIHWMVTPVARGNFTGRHDLMSKLQAIVTNAARNTICSSPCRIVISGIGGLGKSEICLQLANRARQFFWGIFWVDVSTPLLAETGFLKIAEIIGHTTQDWHQVRELLANSQEPWLLVLDNADNLLQDYQQYFPAGSSGVVVLTSRNESCSDLAAPEHFIALDSLTESDAIQLLLRVAKIPEDRHKAFEEDAGVVARLLESHPLALVQAASYIAGNFCSISEYPKVFQKNSRRLLSFRPDQAQARYKDVYATFEASAEALKRSTNPVAREALELLSTLAAFGPRHIPVTMFQRAWKGARKVKARLAAQDDDNDIPIGTTTNVAPRILLTDPMQNNATESKDIEYLSSWHLSRLSPLLHVNSLEWDQYDVLSALNLLRSLALITMDSENETLTISMHPLVHAWAKDRQEPAASKRSWVRAACLLAMTIKFIDQERSSRYETQTKPHLRALMATGVNEIFSYAPQLPMLQILYQCLRMMWVISDYLEHEKHMEQLFNYLKVDLETIDPRWLVLYHYRASCFTHLGKIDESIAIFERKIEVHARISPETDLNLLDSQHELAIAYVSSYQYDRAIDILKRVVKIRAKHLPEEDPDRLASQHALAGAYIDNGQPSRAIDILENVVKIRAKVSSEEHPTRLSSQHELARACLDDGQPSRAIDILENVVKIRAKILPEEYPSRLDSQHELARAYMNVGQNSRAIDILENVVKIETKVLPEDHPSRLVSRHELAVAYWDNNQHSQAMALMQEVVEIQKRSLAKDHPGRLKSEGWLEVMYKESAIEDDGPSRYSSETSSPRGGIE